MRGYMEAQHVYVFDCASVYVHTVCVRPVKALVSSGGCAGSSEPKLIAYAMSTKILRSG